MKNRIRFTALGGAILLGLLGLFAAPVPAADTHFPVAAERSGIQKIYALIDNVSLRQNDRATNQSLVDVLRMKSQLHTSELPTTVPSARLSVQGRPLPPARHRHHSF